MLLRQRLGVMLRLPPEDLEGRSPMKRLLLVMFALLIAAPSVCAQDQGVSLGDAARTQQAKKGHPSPNAKVYDNENLPKGGNISTTTGSGYTSTTTTATNSTNAFESGSTSARSSGAKSKDSKEPSAEEAAKEQEAEFRQKVDEAKKNIAQLERELDVLEREERLRVAVFYGDAGNRMRPENMQKNQTDTNKHNETLKAKQAELATSKA